MDTRPPSLSVSEIDPSRNIQCGDTILDAGTVAVRAGVISFPLTANEFRLLQMLFRQPNLLIPKAALMDALFGQHIKRPGEGILRVYMHRVRAHLRDLDSNLSIATRHGIGWILVVPRAPI